MDNIQDLEKQLTNLKKKKLYDEWEIYLDKIKLFCKNLVNKEILHWYSSTGFVLFKVIDFKERYYIDRDGFYGQWSPRRWIELESTSHIVCQVSDKNGDWYSYSGVQHSNNAPFKAIKISGKNKNVLEIGKVEYINKSVNNSFSTTINEISKIGYTEYKEYSDDPNSDRALDKFISFSYIAPIGMYDKAKALADEQLFKTKSFWEEFQPLCENLDKIKL